MEGNGLCCARRMCGGGAPAEKPEREEAAQGSGAPAEGSAAGSQAAPEGPPRPPPPPPRQPHAWIAELLDDVRYLIACTNWY